MFTKLIKAILLTGVCTLAALLPACTPSGPHVVDYPWINYSNNSTIDISSVELTDSNTVLHINAHYIPNYWIKIASDGYLLADGKKYPIIATDGIELDKEFWMPESGHADFRVIFQPLPYSTKKFDYIESESSGAFKLYGVDLTGNKVDEYPEGLPKEFKKTFADGNVPEPIFEMGKTTINFHLLPNDAPFQPDLTMYVNTMSDTQEEYPITLDSKGNGSVSFEQYGSASAFVAGDNSTYAILTLAPGETIDCYIDTRLSGNLAMRNRENHPYIYHRSIHNGKYSNFDLMKSQLRDYYGFQLHTGVFADYHMTGAEYMDMVKSRYLAQSDTIMHADIPDMAKEYAMLQLQGNVLEAIGNYRYFLGHNYRHCKKDWRSPVPADSIKATLTESDFAEVTKWFDAASPRLLMAGPAAGYSYWNAYGAKGA
ncbi:MAG: hypothetical protein K2F79_00265, partial [Muribaculaceae bacterium]|nr:hypothetical protein [Muribaculaceae bacterium]